MTIKTYRFDAAAPWIRLLTVAGILATLSGCASLFGEGAATGAGVAGAGIASAVSNNAAVASGIGLGVQAAAQAGVQAVERDYHGDQQDRIAAVAGPLAVGAVGNWDSHHKIPLDANAHGRVTVSRVVSSTPLSCKEIIFSVDQIKKKEPISSFYVATICQDNAVWKWATAEPATGRWGALQ
jgi:hypothetical protein